MACDYCRRDDCHECKSKLYWQIRPILDAMEQELCKADAIDETGIINNHLRVAWGVRDAIAEILAVDAVKVGNS